MNTPKAPPQEFVDRARKFLERLRPYFTEAVPLAREFQSIAEAAKAQERERLVALVKPGIPSCGCIKQEEFRGEKYWRADCYCGNSGDLESAAAWIERQHIYESLVCVSVDEIASRKDGEK